MNFDNKFKCFVMMLGCLILTFINAQANAADFEYLSNIPYDSELSYAGNGYKICLDKNQSSNMLNLLVDNEKTYFIKGVCTWADSEIVYDLSGYDYDYFTSYLGVDTAQVSTYYNTGVRFYIYTSDDCENWNLKYSTGTLYGKSNAAFAKVDIKDVNYLKLFVDNNSSNWWASWYDEAVYADAKLIKEGYVEDNSTVDFIKKVEEYDEIIKSYDADTKISGDYELTLLQREFVSNVGYDVLQALAKYSKEYRDVIEWLMLDAENLRLYLVGGKPEGTYSNSIAVLAELYDKYGEDLLDTSLTDNGTVKGKLYRTMMFSISLTHSGKVYLWINGVASSDAVTRYEIYKDLHANKKINSAVFETLTVEEMRWVMNTIIDDEEIVWLNDFIRRKGSTNPYSYVRYTSGYNYSLAKYYSEENYEKWNEKYNLEDYNITYKAGNPKLWIVFEEGAVCGGISKSGSCIWGSYMGLPNTCVSQPGHCAYITYSQDANGNGIWTLGNDISGWGQSGNTEHLNVRMMNDWGMGSYASGWKASYILLGQAAQNEYPKYEKSEIINMLAKVYQDDNETLQSIYRDSLKAEKINLDAWVGLIEAYKKDDTKTEEDFYELAEEVVNALNYYPLPMYHMLNLIGNYFETPAYKSAFDALEYRALVTATKATSSQSIQSNAVKQVANFLLGYVDATMATFSFDGENAGKIILAEKYAGNGVSWDYSLDNGNTWTLVTENEIELTEEELDSITASDDIKVHIIGVDYSESNIFTIDILPSAGLPTNLYANDLEDAIMGTTSALEWKIDGSDEWIKYSEEVPDLTGDVTVTIRVGATGHYMAGEDEVSYDFTEDNRPDTEKYIPIKYLSIEDFSSENVRSNKKEFEYAVNTIDGNINTWWHTSRVSTTDEKYIVIKLEQPVYLSKIEFVPMKNYTWGVLRDATVYASEDGEEWIEIAQVTDSANNDKTKNIEIENPINTQYVKIQATKTYQPNGNYNYFFQASMINLFEDITQRTEPNVELEYSITELTNEDVVVTLISDKEVEILNNDGENSYTFEENGEFTFKYKTKSGSKYEITAVVDWIDKEPPTATISYDITTTVNHDVIATLECDEEIIITNNDGSNTYTFTENDEFTFKFVDLAGNKGRATAVVDWIDKEAPKAWIVYDIETMTARNVIATLMCDEDIIIENNRGSNVYVFTENDSFEFIYADRAGNRETITATVDWINKEAPKCKISYSITTLTNKDVIATLECDDEITVLNNDGSNEYIFTENGSFVFEFENEAGIQGSEVAIVDWIDKEPPVAMISYTRTLPTTGPVLAILNCGEDCEDEIIVTNNDGSNEYLFTENGEFTFEYEDLAGNKATATAIVDWILEEVEEVPSEISTNIDKYSFKVNKEVEFNVEIIANDYEGKLVSATFDFSNTSGVKKLEYYDEENEEWIKLDGAIDFVLEDAIIKFKVTFKTSGKYTFGVQITELETEKLLCDLNTNINVSKKTTSSSSSSSTSTNKKKEETTPVVTEKEETVLYSDVKSTDWFYPAVKYVTNNSIMNGTGNNNFSPDATTTRAMIVVMLWRINGQKTTGGQIPFKDVDSKSWYAEAVRWAAAHDIINGVTEDEFRPDDNVTREQLVTIIYRYARAIGKNTNIIEDPSFSSYLDTSEISNYAVGTFKWACKSGIITGRSDTTLEPKGNATRAEMATVIMRYCEKFEK